MTSQELLSKYQEGQRYFNDIDMDCQDLSYANLEGIVFEKCFLAVNFTGANLKNSKFLNGNIKTCTFNKADLTNTVFDTLSIESTEFKGAKTDGIIGRELYCHSYTLNQKEFEEYIRGN